MKKENQSIDGNQDSETKPIEQTDQTQKTATSGSQKEDVGGGDIVSVGESQRENKENPESAQSSQGEIEKASDKVCDSERNRMENGRSEKVLLARVTFHPDTQARFKIDPKTVDSYAKRMMEGERFSPVVLFEEEGKSSDYYVGDGWHRLKAAKRIGYQNFPAEIRTGGLEAASLYALAANASHGKKRSPQDIRKVVSMACKRFPDLDAQGIAKVCALEESVVDAHLAELRTPGSGKAVGTKPARTGKESSMKAKSLEGSYRRIKKSIRRMPLSSQRQLYEFVGLVLKESEESCEASPDESEEAEEEVPPDLEKREQQ